MRSTFLQQIPLLAAAASLAACGDPRAAMGEAAGAAARCTPCHGDPARPAGADPLFPAAPPLGTKGETATSARAVGAHPQHASVLCGECHVVPNSVGHSNRVVDMAFGPVATTGGAIPVWDNNALTCAASYCHGNFPPAGNAGNVPVWTSPRASACGTCHALPPASTATGAHPSTSDCSLCHVGYTGSSVNQATHVNGRADIGGAACTACHGDSTRAPVAGADPNVKVAPPVTKTGRSPGAHLAHVNKTGGIMTPAQCAECHAGAVPTSFAGHPSGTITVAFGGRGGSAGAYDQIGLNCSSTYCHGNFTGGSGAAPNWASATAMTCTSCHGIPPSTGRHGRSEHVAAGCGACHPGYTSSTVNVALHVNGAKSWGNRITSFNGTTCTNTCHDPESWR